MNEILTAKQLVAKVQVIVDTSTTYRLGTFGNKKINNKVQWDCSGLLKGILWGYPENGKYLKNGVLDQNADTIISTCKEVSEDFNTIVAGEVVWIKGHMGIYIGDGKVVEATPKWENGVQISSCANIISGSKSRKWIKHGKSPYIDYLEEASNVFQSIKDEWVARLQKECNLQGYSNQIIDGIAGINTLMGCPQLGINSKGTITTLVQEYLNKCGYDCGVSDGINGTKTQLAIKQFQKDHQLKTDGIVGKNTWKAILKI